MFATDSHVKIRLIYIRLVSFNLVSTNVIKNSLADVKINIKKQSTCIFLKLFLFHICTIPLLQITRKNLVDIIEICQQLRMTVTMTALCAWVKRYRRDVVDMGYVTYVYTCIDLPEYRFSLPAIGNQGYSLGLERLGLVSVSASYVSFT